MTVGSLWPYLPLEQSTPPPALISSAPAFGEAAMTAIEIIHFHFVGRFIVRASSFQFPKKSNLFYGDFFGDKNDPVTAFLGPRQNPDWKSACLNRRYIIFFIRKMEGKNIGERFLRSNPTSGSRSDCAKMQQKQSADFRLPDSARRQPCVRITMVLIVESPGGFFNRKPSSLSMTGASSGRASRMGSGGSRAGRL